MSSKTDICGVKHAKWLDNRLRRFVHNPRRLFRNYIQPGIILFDIGCGPGAFTKDFAEMVGPEGKVLAIDVQEDMLAIVGKKVAGTLYENRVICHHASGGSIGIKTKADFIVTFYMVHETPDPMRFVDEVASLLQRGGYWYVAEPAFHVTRKGYMDVVERGKKNGLSVVEESGILSRVVVFHKK